MRVKKHYCTASIQYANTILPLSRHLLFTWHTARLRFNVNKGRSDKSLWNGRNERVLWGALRLVYCGERFRAFASAPEGWNASFRGAPRHPSVQQQPSGFPRAHPVSACVRFLREFVACSLSVRGGLRFLRFPIFLRFPMLVRNRRCS